MKPESDSTPMISHYDPHLIPPESVARAAREGKQFGHIYHKETGDGEDSHMLDGYTIDQEGLINNYPIEPEIYINEPGDLREQEQQRRDRRLHELLELSEDEDGKLTMEHDWRHKGPGLI